MALTAYCVWEVRPGSGSDTNGGGFDNSVTSPGTDYSQQNSAQVTLNGTTVTAHAAGVTSTIILTGYTVATGDVGNVVHISGGTGFTAGWYTIVSVSVGSVTWTLDRNCTTGVASGATGAMGGAWNSAANFTGTSIAVAGNIVWIKATASITLTSGLTFQSSGASGLRLSIRGYTTTRGDGLPATITTATNSIVLCSVTNISGLEFMSINFTSTAGTPGDCFRSIGTGDASSLTFQNCVFSGFAIAIDGNYALYYEFDNIVLIECEIKSCVSHGIFNDGATIMYGCYVHGNGGDGFRMQTGNTDSYLFAYGCVFASNSGNGCNDQSQAIRGMYIQNCDLYNNTGAGALVGAGNSFAYLTSINCIYYTNGTFGINFQTPGAGAAIGTIAIQRNNFFGGGSQVARNTGAPTGVSDVTLTANPFNSPSTGDFSLNSTTGGGAAVTGAGWQSAII